MAAMLREHGVDPSILDITSHGEGNPLVPTGDQVSEPRNRRVEITVR
jgi:outer membrane protein OmpA-like peptidoglycan-associated protein